MEYTLLKKINSCGRKIAVKCVDDELYENEVLLSLLVYHKFNQLDVNLEEGCALLFPDFTADEFLKLKMELYCSKEMVRDLFFPENISSNKIVQNDVVTTGAKKEEAIAVRPCRCPTPY